MLWGLFGSSMMTRGGHCLALPQSPPPFTQTTPFPFRSGGAPGIVRVGVKLSGHGLGGPWHGFTIQVFGASELSVNIIVVVPSEPVRVSVQTNPSRLLSVVGTCGSTAAA